MGSVEENGDVTITDTRAVAGELLTEDITLVAKWTPIRSVHGSIQVAGTYQQGDTMVAVHSVDRALEATVILERMQHNDLTNVTQAVTIASKKVPITWSGNDGTAQYLFENLAAGTDYHIRVVVTNYTAGYCNEDPSQAGYRADGNKAVYRDDEDIDAIVDADLRFTPDPYTQNCIVDATAIGAGTNPITEKPFRPSQVQAVIAYAQINQSNFAVISQHGVDPYGLTMTLAAEEGSSQYRGTGSQTVWNYHWTNVLYAYQLEVTQVDGKAPQSTDPFTISYGSIQTYGGQGQSGDLIAYL